MLREEGQLIAALAERGQANDERGEREIEVRPDLPARERDVGIKDRRADEPHGRIEGGNQLRLQVAWELEYLTKQNGRAFRERQSWPGGDWVRRLVLCAVSLARRCEAKSSRSSTSAGSASGIEGNERSTAMRGVMVDGAGDKSLSGSLLA